MCSRGVLAAYWSALIDLMYHIRAVLYLKYETWQSPLAGRFRCKARSRTHCFRPHRAPEQPRELLIAVFCTKGRSREDDSVLLFTASPFLVLCLVGLDLVFSISPGDIPIFFIYVTWCMKAIRRNWEENEGSICTRCSRQRQRYRGFSTTRTFFCFIGHNNFFFSEFNFIHEFRNTRYFLLLEVVDFKNPVHSELGLGWGLCLVLRLG